MIKIIPELASILENKIKKYPSIFKTGGDVLHHMFLVIGNGYEWDENGNLYCEEYIDKDYDEYESFENYLKSHEWLTSYNIDDKSFISMIQRWYERDISIINTAKERSFNPKLTRDKLYPYCEKYSEYFNVPDNIQFPWTNALEVIKWMLENYERG